MSTVKEETKSKITPAIEAFAQKLRKDITIDTKTGVAAEASASYIKYLPEGLTEDILKKAQAYKSEFTAATALAIGLEAEAVVKKHKALDRVELVVPLVGKDTLEFTYNRASMVPDRSAGAEKGARTEKYGTMSVSETVYSVGNRGQLGHIRDMLSASATAAYGKK